MTDRTARATTDVATIFIVFGRPERAEHLGFMISEKPMMALAAYATHGSAFRRSTSSIGIPGARLPEYLSASSANCCA
jgi:hypothetical protein